MKTIFIIVTAVFFILPLIVFPQIKVYEDNRVKIFGDIPADDTCKDLSMQVYGPYNEYLGNGKLGFGTYGLNESTLFRKRVFVGELGTNINSDKLELCGSQGLCLTWGQGYDYNNIIGEAVISMNIISNVLTIVRKFYFYTDVYANGILLNSDERFKENISPLSGSLNKLKKVNGISFNLKMDQANSTLTENNGFTSQKEQSDMALLAATKEKLENNKRERLGFVAQELKEVFPELVEEDTNGNLRVDYLGLIPLLVESIKEQQAQLAMLKSALTDK